MFKSIAVLVAATQATNLLNLAVVPADAITTDTTTGDLIPADTTKDTTGADIQTDTSGTDSTDTTGTDSTTDTSGTDVKPSSDGTDVIPSDGSDVVPVEPVIEPTDGEFGPQQTVTVSDITKFGLWKQQIFELAKMKYRHFVPIYYSKFTKGGVTVNFKVTFDVGSNPDDEEHLIAVVDVSELKSGKGFPIVESVITPDGVMHDAADIHDGGHDPHDHGKKWKKDIQKNLKKKFKEFEKRIKEFAKKIAGKKDYEGKFDPVQFKADINAEGQVTYTIQYEIDDGKLVQATVVVPPVVKDSDGAAAATQPDPEITQFISDDGTVTGAMQLKTSFVMMATLVATVMLS